VKDYYFILGVSRIASSTEIKTAYRNGCKQYHPDKKEYAARNRAREYARQDFEEFKKSKYYKVAVGVNNGFNYLFLSICILIIVVPLYMYILQQELPEKDHRPFLGFLVPMIMGFAMGTWACYYWFIKKQDIFTIS
jgi:hypothetical protein